MLLLQGFLKLRVCLRGFAEAECLSSTRMTLVSICHFIYRRRRGCGLDASRRYLIWKCERLILREGRVTGAAALMTGQGESLESLEKIPERDTKEADRCAAAQPL